MVQAITKVSLHDIAARKLAGDFTGAAEMISEALRDAPEDFLDASAWNLLINQPISFDQAHDHESNVLFVTAVMLMIYELSDELDSTLVKGVIDAFLQGAQFRLTAHSDVDVKELMAMRARLFFQSSFVLPNHDHAFSTSVANQWRPRVGILFRHLRADPETTSLLPFISQAKKSGIELILFVAEDSPTDAFSNRIGNSCDKVVRISQNLPTAVSQLRDADLDVLIFGNDITAKLSLGACLSFHKVAHRSVCTVSTLVTTASPYIDEYFGCAFHADRGAAKEYFERFVSLPGPGFAFCFDDEKSPSQVTISRNQLGLSERNVLFVSGANHTKLHGHLLDAWAEILRRTPESVLFLYPFPPHFGSAQQAVVERVRSRFERHGIAPSRLIVLPQLPGRSAVKSLLLQMDIGLDSFPYPGVTTIVDSVESYLPTVTLAGQTLRSSQGAAVLFSVGAENLVAYDLPQYIESAVALANQPELRKEVSARIRKAMAGSPPFLDEVRFGRAAVHQYFRIHGELAQSRGAV